MTLIEVGFETERRIGDSSSEGFAYMATELLHGMEGHRQYYDYQREIVILLKGYFHNLRNNWDSQVSAPNFDDRKDVFNLFTDELETGMCFALEEAKLLAQHGDLEGLLAAQAAEDQPAVA